MRRSAWVWATVVCLLLAGCRVVQIRVGEDPPQLNNVRGGSSALPVFEDDLLIRPVGAPVVLFTEAGATAEFFTEPGTVQDYLILKQTGSGYGLRLSPNVVWAEGVAGGAGVETLLTLLDEDEPEPQLIDEASIGYFDEFGPMLIDEELDVRFYPPGPGEYALRMEVFVFASADDGEPIDEQAALEVRLVVLSPPEAPPSEEGEDGAPRFGGLEEDWLFLDWRAWGGGPCRLTDTDEALTILLDEACLAFESENFEELQRVFVEIAENSDDAALQAALRDQIGLTLAADGQWELAARQFREALRLWQSLDDAARVSMALHNLGVVTWAMGEFPQAEGQLIQALDLREMMDDFAGLLLTWGQLGVMWEEPDVLYETADVLGELGWSQAGFLREAALTYDND